MEGVGLALPEILRVFAGKSVLVTGHTGFKGSWLALWLHRLGACVTGYSLQPPTVPSHFEAACIREVLEHHYEADIRDCEALHGALQACQPEAVFHLAAQSLVRESYLSPRATFDVNVVGTACVLDAVRALNRPCTVVVVTSDKCYENKEQVWGYRENDAMGGSDPYSASKGACELVVNAYRRSFFCPARLSEHGVKLATVRAGNVIGGGDWARDRIVPDLVHHLVRGEPLPVRNPRAVRPWQHVLEPLGGYLALAARMLGSNDPKWCDAWNFGPGAGEGASVRELVERFCGAWAGGGWQDASVAGPPEAGLLRLCIDKALAELDWRPRWDLAETTRRAVAWYRHYYAQPGASMREASLADIEAYGSAR
jgi:CDP-glucose 4,6-dehydratase